MRRMADDDFEETEYAPEAEDAGELPCPKCGAAMYGDAVRCPICGTYVTPGAKPSSGHPWWIWLGVALLVAATLGMGLALAVMGRR